MKPYATLRQIVEHATIVSADHCITEYSKAETTPIPWIWEEKFAQEIAEYCARICEDLGTAVVGTTEYAHFPFDDCAYQIRKEFGLCQ